MKKIEEIEARIAAATPGPWEAVTDDDPRGQPVPYYRGLVALIERNTGRALSVVLKDGRTVPACDWQANAQLIAHAPADLALLAAIVRSVAEAECSQFNEEWGRPCIEIPLVRNRDIACWPCRVRRELEVAR